MVASLEKYDKHYIKEKCLVCISGNAIQMPNY